MGAPDNSEDTKEDGTKNLLSDVKARFENILSFDVETVPNGDTYHIGAVFKGKIFRRKEIKVLEAAFRDLSEFSKEADYILGHNIINHDLVIVKETTPTAAFLNLPVIDTLFLSPLAFPENPYHRLIKDYKLNVINLTARFIIHVMLALVHFVVSFEFSSWPNGFSRRYENSINLLN